MIKKTSITRKVIISVIIILVIIGGYVGYKIIKNKPSETRYVLAKVEKGTLISSVSGSGQISASNQVDIKSKASGDVVYVGIKNGQEVKSGALLAQIDSTAAQKTVRDAETTLETAKLQLEELISPPDELTLFQAENALSQAKNSLTKLKFTQETSYQKALQTKQKAIDNITKGYEDSFNTIETAFFNLPTIMIDLWTILYDDTINENQLNTGAYQNYIKYDERSEILSLITIAENDYKTAEAKYTPNMANYKRTSRYAEQSVIDALLTETLETAKAVAQIIKSEKNLIDYVVDYTSQRNTRIPAIIRTYQSNLATYLTQANTYYSNLLSRRQIIQDNKDTLTTAEQDLLEIGQNQPLDLVAAQINVEEKEKKLADLKAGPDEFDVRGQKITIQQKEDALASAKENLGDYFVKAPFDGVVTKINIKKGDSVSSSTTLATLITKQKIAEISLNEVDAAKVKVGQKVTLTFDAIEELSITGEVIDVDTIGTVSQGVVTYNVKINFDTQDERVKPSMSVSASIITEVKQDVLLIPNSAVKSSDDTSYAEILDSTAIPKQSTINKITIASKISPQQQSIQIGSANDSSTEIISGLKEGDWVITATSGSSTTQSQQSKTTDTFRIMPGVGGMGMPR